jgi:CRP-like cAMP-binding protein
VWLLKEKPLMAPTLPAKKKRDFDPKKFLATIGEGRKVMAFPKKQTIFTQGEAADAVFYIQEGKVDDDGRMRLHQPSLKKV